MIKLSSISRDEQSCVATVTFNPGYLLTLNRGILKSDGRSLCSLNLVYLSGAERPEVKGRLFTRPNN
jgi:hypothetical protein